MRVNSLAERYFLWGVSVIGRQGFAGKGLMIPPPQPEKSAPLPGENGGRADRGQIDGRTPAPGPQRVRPMRRVRLSSCLKFIYCKPHN
jgi:hypothetical protein